MGTNPQAVAAILKNGYHPVVAQAFAVTGLMAVMFKYTGFFVQPVQAFMGANPNIALAILIQTPDTVMTEAVSIFRVVEVVCKGVGFSVVVIKPPLTAKPDVSLIVLQNGPDMITGKVFWAPGPGIIVCKLFFAGVQTV